MYAHYLVELCESKLWRNVVNFTLLLTTTRGLRRKQFSSCSKHIICLHCYCERSKCSPLVLTHAVRWWHRWRSAYAWWYGLPSLDKQSWILLYYIGNVSLTQYRTQNAYLHNLLQANNCFFFFLYLVWVFAEGYVKLQYIVTSLSYITM